MASLDIKNATGQRVGAFEFDSSVLESRITPRLLRDAFLAYEASARRGTVSVKTKAEIKGSKAKLFRQKGTGRARMGQKRTPIRRGGGNAFGRATKDWRIRIPRKALRTATRMALVGKLRDGEVILIDQLKLPHPRTKDVAQILKRLEVGNRSCLLVIAEHDRTLCLATRNIPKVALTTAGCLNSHDVIKHRLVVMTREALDLWIPRLTA
jgi:large subunit ribosomal protein L4